MSHFGNTQDVAFFVNSGLAFILAVLTLSELSLGRSPTEMYLFLPVLSCHPLAAGVLYLQSNHGRGRTLRSRLQRRAASLLVGPIKACGCWASSDDDTVEEDHVAVRSETGARVRFEARNRQLRRCHDCGHHYHTTTDAYLRDVADDESLAERYDTFQNSRVGRRQNGVEAWPEEEPNVRDGLEAPVLEDSEI